MRCLHNVHKAVQRPPHTNRGKGRGRGDVPVFNTTQPLFINDTTDSAAAPATTSTTPAAKFSVSEPNPSGSQKNHIWAVIAEVIFEKDEEYKDVYAEDKHKFTMAVSNHIT
ncbi:hypothetical protein EV424DRAFT_1354953, partial [Suillus variegatus]